MRWGKCALATPALLLSAPLAAGEPYYFHKPQVDREAYIADVAECTALAGGVRVTTRTVYSPNMYQQMASAIFAPLMAGAERRRIQSRVERTCMADKGYRRMAVDKPTINAIRKLEAKERVDRLFAMASDAVAVGKEMPE